MIVRKTSIAAVVSLFVIAASGTASAAQVGWTTIEYPATACNTLGSTGFGVSGPKLINWGSSPAYLFCPLLLTDIGGPYQSLSSVTVTVNRGWATTSSCELVYGVTNDNFVIVAPTSITNTGLQDVVGWTNSNLYQPNYGAEVQCSVPQYQQVWDDSVRSYIFFDWSNW